MVTDNENPRDDTVQSDADSWGTHVRKLYERGVSLAEEKKAYQTVIDRRFMSEQIDWEKDVNASEEQLKLLIQSAMRFHYTESSQLVACGRIVEHGPSVHAKRVGLLLGMSHMAYMDTWGNYMSHRGDVAVDDISNTSFDAEMVTQLLNESDVANLLVWIGTLGTVAMSTVLKYGVKASDPVFTTVANRMRTAKEEDEQIIQEYLINSFGRIDADEGEVVEYVRDYRPTVRKQILGSKESFRVLGVDEHIVASEVVTNINEFYRNIGIDPDELESSRNR